MDLRKCKVGAVIFSILFSGIILSDWHFKGVALFIWVLSWLAATISFLAKQKGHTTHYGIFFVMTIVLSVAFLMAEDFITQGMICLGIFYSGLLALYRTCYRETSLSDMAKDVNYLLFANLPLLIDPGELSPQEKEKRTFQKIAIITAFLCFVLFTGMGRFADIHIANLMRLMWKLISENIAYILFSIITGLGLATMLYGYLYSLLKGMLGPEGIRTNTSELSKYEKENRWIDFFCNPICGTWILNIIILCDTIFLIVNLFFYWNPFGLDFESDGNAYRTSGFTQILLIIILSNCIFGGIYYILECEKRKTCEEKMKVLAEKCRYRFIVAVLATFMIWVFAVARYCHIVYANGINSSNKHGVLDLVICIVVLGYFLLYGFNLSKSGVLKGYFGMSIALVILTAFLWSSITFPMYNMLLFTNKIEHQKLAYSFTGQPMQEIIITEKDIDIGFMEESGLYAVASLIKLLDYSNIYEGTDGSVSDTAMKSIGRIFAAEFFDNRDEINAAEGGEKILLIAEYMGNDPGYLLGIRRQCRQSVIKYISKHN